MVGPLCIQGNVALNMIYDKFRICYVEKNPGCNGNDVDREFLTALLEGIELFHREDLIADISNETGLAIVAEVEKIR